MKKTINIFLIFILLLSLYSCAPSYPKKTLVKQTEDLILQDTGLSSTVFLKGTTLFIYMNVNGINSTLTVDSKVLDLIQKALMGATRVSLSTDAKIDFFCVVIASEKNGVSIIFKQYVDDVKRWFYGFVGRSDFFKRSLFETKMLEHGYIFSEADYSAITMPDFILDQTAYRFRATLAEDLEEMNKKLSKMLANDPGRKKLEKEMKQYRSWSLIIDNTLTAKKYENFEGKGHYFQYIFQDFDRANLLGIQYNDFYKKLVAVHKEVADIYKFTDYFAVYINRGENKVFEATPRKLMVS